jgi:putative aldouronate transport system substrate-binding protein
MKKTGKFVFLAAVLLAGAVQVFAGGARQSGGQQAAQDLGARGSGPAYWLVKYPQTVTLHTVNYDYPQTVYEAGDSTAHNGWIRAIKEYLNIDIVTDWVAATATDYTTKLNLAIAAGQIPDFFYCDSTQFSLLLEAGLLADITGYVENNICDALKGSMEANPEVIESATKNGRLYAWPQFGVGSLDDPNELWIRKDWREQAGLKAPATIAELETLMQTFMRAHPGSYGMPLGGNLDEFNWLAPAFGAYPTYWITAAGGSIVYGSIQNEMKQVLQTFADWYKKGYFKQDWMSSNYDSNRSDLIAGKYGVQVFPQWWGFVSASDMITTYGRNGYMEAFELPSFNGKPVNHPKPFENGGYIAINKNCRNIAAALKCVSFWAGGIQARELVDTGIVTQEQRAEMSLDQHNMPMLKSWDSRTEIEIYRQLQEVKRTGNTQALKQPSAISSYDSAIRPFLEAGDISGAGRWLQMYADNSSYSVNEKILNENRWVQSRMAGPVPEGVAAYGSTLSDILIEGFVQIIAGQQPVSYFDTLVSRWKAAGGDDCTRVMNQVYGNR